MAYKIQKNCQNVSLTMYDKEADLGGTWYLNRYPGAGCDIPSHAYSYPFALNPDWPQYCSHQPDIWKYLNKVCDVFELRKYMQFKSKITRAEWLDDVGKWKIEVTKNVGDTEQISEEFSDVFLYATGALNGAKWPEVEDLDEFKGKMIHSSAWPDNYGKEQWKEERVAVIGVGASSVQIVSNIQPHVKSMDIFVRTGTWFSRIADNFGDYKPYSEEQLTSFSHDAEALVSHAKAIENDLSICLDLQIAGSDMQKGASEWTKAHMREHIKDDRLFNGFLPNFGLGCRRITPADPYMRAIQEPNVTVHFSAAARLTSDSIIAADGTSTPIDTIICASGFDTSYRPRFPIIGRDGVNLAEKWKRHPEAYLGITVPDMPNFFMFMGPSWPVHNGSIMGPLIATGDYVIAALQKIQRDCITCLSPKASSTRAFNEHVQKFAERTVWVESCRSWFKNSEGRVTALWPGTGLHFVEALRWPRWEDYEIRREHDNEWAVLGNGFCWSERTEGVDKTPFLSVEALDEKWRKEVLNEGRKDETAEANGQVD